MMKDNTEEAKISNQHSYYVMKIEAEGRRVFHEGYFASLYQENLFFGLFEEEVEKGSLISI